MGQELQEHLSKNRKHVESVMDLENVLHAMAQAFLLTAMLIYVEPVEATDDARHARALAFPVM